MTKVYAAKKLLEHGPLTFPQFCAITGWTTGYCNNVLEKLWVRGEVERFGTRNRYVYQLAGGGNGY